MDFYKKVRQIVKKDSRFKPDAYEFVMQGLWFTQKKLKRDSHVSGRELLDGIRDFALEQYGPMARTVFAHWGVENTADFGEIVFNMVENGLMSKTEKDSRDDFRDVFDFSEAFNVYKISPAKESPKSPDSSSYN